MMPETIKETVLVLMKNPRKLSRRDVLAAGAGAAASVAIPGSWIGGNTSGSRAAAKATTTLTPSESTASILEDGAEPVSVWAYDNLVPGPVIRSRRNEPIHVRLNNGLSQPTSIHWHGIRIDNAMDGVSGLTQDPVQPGDSFDYQFIAPDAGTYWYHPHHRSWEQMARGLYGALIIEEDTPPDVDQDLLFIADDWRITPDGNLDNQSFGAMRDWSHGGRLGNWLTVNGLSAPVFDVRTNERIRLRCINTANSRILAFRFDGMQGHLVALDGQPLNEPRMGLTEIMLAPAQRADLILDVTAKPGEHLAVWEVSTQQAFEAAYFQVSSEPGKRSASRPEPVILLPNLPGDPPLNQGPRRIDLLMEGGAMGGMRSATYKGQLLDIRDLVNQGMVWAFNGVAGRMETPLLRIERGRTAIINMINQTSWPHAMHLHGFHFKVVERNGKAVTGAPWRDTELVEANEQVAIAFVSDNPGKWLLHCHMLEHQVAGMITWIESL